MYNLNLNEFIGNVIFEWDDDIYMYYETIILGFSDPMWVNKWN